MSSEERATSTSVAGSDAVVGLALRRRRLSVWIGAAVLALHTTVTVVDAVRLEGAWTTDTILTLAVCGIVGIALAVVRRSRLRAVETVTGVRPEPRRNAAAGVYLLALPTILFLGMGAESISVDARPTRVVEASVPSCDDGCTARWTVGGETYSDRISDAAKPGDTVRIEVVRDQPSVLARSGDALLVRGMPIVLLISWGFLVSLWLRQARRLNAQLAGLVRRSE